MHLAHFLNNLLRTEKPVNVSSIPLLIKNICNRLNENQTIHCFFFPIEMWKLLTAKKTTENIGRL